MLGKISLNKITLLTDDLWVIRSTRQLVITEMKDLVSDIKIIKYYETPSTWNTAPTKATIFTSYEAAEGHMRLMFERDFKGMPPVWADGSVEHFDVVSLSGEIIHSPNGKTIQVKKSK